MDTARGDSGLPAKKTHLKDLWIKGFIDLWRFLRGRKGQYGGICLSLSSSIVKRIPLLKRSTFRIEVLLPFGAKNTIKYNLVLNISEKIRKLQPQKILITEAEKHLSGIREIIKQTPNFELSLTTQLKPMSLLLNLAFGEKSNVTIRFESIYTDCLQDEKFDYIYSLPIFGYKLMN